MRAISTPDDHFCLLLLTVWFFFAGLAAPNDISHGEGFLLTFTPNTARHELLIAGIDDRGCLYGVGELLRQATFHDDGFTLPDDDIQVHREDSSRGMLNLSALPITHT